MQHLPSWKNYKIILQSLSFLIIAFFLATYGTSSPPKKELETCLTKDQEADLEYFLNFLLFENYGAFVLFGSKPMCEMMLVDSMVIEEEQKRKLELMSDEERNARQKEIEELKTANLCFEFAFERNLYHGWLVLKQLRTRIKTNRFVFGIREQSKGIYDIFLLDAKKVTKILKMHYTIFKKAVGYDFDPINVVFEIDSPDSKFWNRILEVDNHIAKGLLFGFGEKNSIAFDNHMQATKAHQDTNLSNFHPSVIVDMSKEFGHRGLNNFTIPIFGCFDNDVCKNKYEKEKKTIEHIYKNNPLIKVTLRKLHAG